MVANDDSSIKEQCKFFLDCSIYNEKKSARHFENPDAIASPNKNSFLLVEFELRKEPLDQPRDVDSLAFNF